MNKIENIIVELTETYLDLKAKITEIDNMICPPFPVKPIAATLDEFDNYKKLKAEYDGVVNLKGTDKKDLEKHRDEIKLEIIKSLPASNTWFLMDENKIAIGHRSDDWPSSHGDLLIVKNPIIEDLKEINHQVIN